MDAIQQASSKDTSKAGISSSLDTCEGSLQDGHPPAGQLQGQRDPLCRGVYKRPSCLL